MADYLNQLLQLQPPGEALPTDPDSTWVKLLDGLAQELERVDSRAAALIRESDPRQALELLADWERVCGLPGDCLGQHVAGTARGGCCSAYGCGRPDRGILQAPGRYAGP